MIPSVSGIRLTRHYISNNVKKGSTTAIPGKWSKVSYLTLESFIVRERRSLGLRIIASGVASGLRQQVHHFEKFAAHQLRSAASKYIDYILLKCEALALRTVLQYRCSTL